MNYQQLSEAIQSYAESTEQLFVFNIPNFVQLCEERVYNAVQIPAIRKNVIGNFTQSDHYLALPEDYLSSFSLAVIDADGNYEYLIDKDVNFIRQAYPNPNDEGLPRYYAQFYQARCGLDGSDRPHWRSTAEARRGRPRFHRRAGRFQRWYQ